MSANFFSPGESSRKRFGDEADLDITPMIDVTFLLLIFFMVTSTMQSSPAIELPVAKHGTGVSRNENVIVSVVDEDGTAVLMAGDPPAPEMSIEEIVAYAQEGIENGKSGIIVKATGTIPSGFIKELTQQLQAIGEIRFHYAVSERD